VKKLVYLAESWWKTSSALASSDAGQPKKKKKD
jgi:hypothetical protein